MSKMNEFDNILDECLERLIEGETIEACLSSYPGHAAQLEPLLRTALNTMKTADVRPRPEFRDRARYQFQMAVREMPVKEKRSFFGAFKPALATVAMLAIVLLAGGGVVAASGSSLPGTLLYPVKLATESVRLALTPSDLGKAELNARFADERIDEIIRMAEKGELAFIEETTDRMDRQLMAVATLTGTGEMVDGQFLGAMNTLEALPPVATAAPTSTPVPSPTPVSPGETKVTETPVPTIVVPEPGSLGGTRDEGAKAVDREADAKIKLAESLARQYLENLQALQDELEKAPDYLKPALQHAIEVAEAAYAGALANLFG